MNEALIYLYYIYNKFIVFVFDTMEIAHNVSFGWIAISVMLFGLIIRSVLNIPKQMGSFDKFREHTYVTNTTNSDGSKTWSQRRVFRR